MVNKNYLFIILLSNSCMNLNLQPFIPTNLSFSVTHLCWSGFLLQGILSGSHKSIANIIITSKLYSIQSVTQLKMCSIILYSNSLGNSN